MTALPLVAAAAALIVVDGDTVKIPETGVRLRLAAIDAPETGHRAGCVEEYALGVAAKARLAEIVAGGVVVIYSGKTGGFNRPLVVLRLPDGRTAGDILILEGLAVPWAGARHDFCTP